MGVKTTEIREIVDARLEIIVANAGIAKAAPIEDHTVESIFSDH